MMYKVVAGNGVRGWLDGSSEHHNWLKLIRSAETKSSANMRYYLQGGQLWYETCVDIPHGTELVLGPREPLNLQDMFGDSTSADEKSDRETGNSRHSRLAPRSEIIVRATPIAVQIIVPIGKTPPSITQRRRNPFYQCYMTQDP
jgi:hypothetical protein